MNRKCSTSPCPTVRNLREMKKHQTGIITAIKAEGDMGRRLREMGLVPGTRVTIQGRAPLYDPVALRVMGGTLSLRNNEADHIEVEVDEKDHTGGSKS